jgi:hypothetical protein
MAANLRWLSGFGVSALCWVTACGVSSDPASLGDDRGLDGDKNETPPAVEATGIIPPTAEQLLALCAQPEQGEKGFTQETLGQASAALVGSWLRCPDDAFVAAPDAAITAAGVTSVEFDASGKVYVLREQNGRLQRGTTAEYQGSWIVEPDQPSGVVDALPGAIGMSVSIDGVRNDKERLFLAEGPKKFRFNGVNYVAAPGPEGVKPPAPTPSPQGPSRQAAEAACPDESIFTSVSFPTDEEYQAAVVGSWFGCGANGLPVFGASDGALGVEFASDGKFYKLYDQGGVLVRGEGFGRVGDWGFVAQEGLERESLQVRVDGVGVMVATDANLRFFVPDGSEPGQAANILFSSARGVSSYFGAAPEDGGFLMYGRIPSAR